MHQILPKNVYRERIDFSKIFTTVPIPNLIEIQRKSYERFLQMNWMPDERDDAGLQSVFKSVFPISDFRENSSLEFIDYSIGNWEPVADVPGVQYHVVREVDGKRLGLKLKYDVQECQERGMTYAVQLKVTIRLVVWNKDPETGVRTIRDIKEQEVYFGDIPLMTDNGTFIINGTERVIVSQLHRSPGAFFHSEDKASFVAQIIPYRGSWVEFEYDAKNLLYVRIDRKRKFLGTVFLRALGLHSSDEIIRAFYVVNRITTNGKSLEWSVRDSLKGKKVGADIKVPGTDIVVKKDKKLTSKAIDGLRQAGVEMVAIAESELEGAFTVADIVDPETGDWVLRPDDVDAMVSAAAPVVSSLRE